MSDIDLWGITHVGRVRKNNEDAYTLSAELWLAVVADGMGGAACGEVASSITVTTIADYVRDYQGPEYSGDVLLREAILLAHQRVLDSARSRNHCHGMASTVVAASWRGGRLTIANVGDSRAYLLRGGDLCQVSYDQTLGNELRTKQGFTEEQIARYPHRRALTMAIGSAHEMAPRLFEDSIIAEDLILLCSDGLHGQVSDGKIREILLSGEELDLLGTRLLDAALVSGGSDNITIALLRLRS